MDDNKQSPKNLIQSYSFGSMRVGGKKYRQDLIIFPDHIKDSWWREEGHSLSLNDLKEVLRFQPDTLVVGKGASGIMKVPSEVKELLEEKGIKVITEETTQAYEIFNQLLREGNKVVGAFHLTC